MLSKTYLLSVSAAISIVLITIGLFGTYTLCRNNESCVDVLNVFFTYLLPILPLFLFALITYWANNKIYKAWVAFALPWTVLSVIAIFFAPEYPSNMFDPIQKGSVALLFSAIFVIVSLGIIIWKYMALGHKRAV